MLTFGRKETREWQTGDLENAPSITADGKVALSVATRDEDWSLVSLSSKGVEDAQVEGQLRAVLPSPVGKEVVLTRLTFEGRWPTPDEPRRFHLARMSLGDQSLGASVGTGYRSCGSPVFSSDGRHLAFKVLDEQGGMGVAIDDQMGAPCPYQFVDELTFSPDGSKLAFSACDGASLTVPESFGVKTISGCEVLQGVRAEGGTWVLVVGDERSAEYEQIRFPTWSPDGSEVACAALENGSWRLVVGTRAGDPCDEIAAIAWDPSGTTVRYGCREGRELRWSELAVK